LIELNLKLMNEAGYRGNYLMEFAPNTMRTIESLYSKIDCDEYRSFVASCEAHRPWVWKDPRLWMTIRFWRHCMNFEDCRFILLTRSSLQIWVSTVLRRQILTYRYHRRYEKNIYESAASFCGDYHLPYLHVTYEDLIQHPAEMIGRLNGHLGTSLTVEDLQAVYHKPLYKSPRHSALQYAKAMLLYLKNYSSRVDVTSGVPQSRQIDTSHKF
jgi:hypothetical protein